jgi:hypothetical protein
MTGTVRVIHLQINIPSRVQCNKALQQLHPLLLQQDRLNTREEKRRREGMQRKLTTSAQVPTPLWEANP